jgi:hypothetical protein
MSNRIGRDFERIGKLVEESSMPALAKQQTAESLRKLPALCEAFCVSYESRDVEKILLLERNMLARLNDPNETSCHDLARTLSQQFKKLHERLGLPQLEPAKARSATARRS